MKTYSTTVTTFISVILATFLLSCQRSGSDKEISERFTVNQWLSSKQITSFCVDSRGYVWIGTKRGLNRLSGSSFNEYFENADTLKRQSLSVNSLVSSDDAIWIGALGGLYCFKYGEGMNRICDEYAETVCDTKEGYIVYGNTAEILRLDKRTLETSSLYKFQSSNTTNQFLTDRFGHLWAFEGKEMACIDVQTGQTLEKEDLPSHFDRALILGTSMYVATAQGMFIFDTNTRKWGDSKTLTTLNEALNGDRVVYLFPYNDKALLAFTYSQRLLFYDTMSRQAVRDDSGNFPFELPLGEVSTIYVDNSLNVYVGTKRHGFKQSLSKKPSFNRNQLLTSFFKDKTIVYMSYDRHGDLWVLSDKKDIYRCRHGNEINLIYSQGKSDISRIWVDAEDYLWVGTSNTLYKGKVEGNSYVVGQEWEMRALAITDDKQGNTLVCSYGGEFFMKRFMSDKLELLHASPSDMKVTKLLNLKGRGMALVEATRGVYFADENGGWMNADMETLLGSNVNRVIYNDICEDNNGNLWVATYGLGLLKIDITTREVRNYDSEEYTHDVGSVIEDDSGHIWMGTQKGLTCLDPATERFMTFYQGEDIVDDEYALRSCAKNPQDGSLTFGSMSGMTSFLPKDLWFSQDSDLQMEYLFLGGTPVQDLFSNANVVLEYDNAGVDFSFTSLRQAATSTTYQYMMEGFDPKWNTVYSEGHAYYSHLPEGKYTLRVKVASTTGETAERSVRVTVKPPWWMSPLMRFFVYPVIVLLFIAGVVYLWYKRMLGKQKLMAAVKEKEQEQMANEMNMRFFSNISHEFRTPLTLINGALSMIESKSNDRLLMIMRRNTQRMMRIINQLMDFNKLENGMLKLSVSKTDVTQLTSQIVEMFEATLKSKGMDCHEDFPSEPIISWVDTDKYEKVMVNLISNAIKYSSEGGFLTVRLSAEEEMLTVRVEDGGIGVPEDKREEIFLRFYQLKHSGRLPAIGTGIGLYYTKSLVELHHGQIRCMGNSPQGSIFTFSLPMNKDAYKSEEIQEDETPISIDHLPASTSETSAAEPDKAISSAKLLLVDDDTEVLNFLQLLLSPYYQIYTFKNALSAYREIETIEPDLILSDVMMYELDGYELCRMVKENATLCHIPVILLTAKTRLEEQIHGLDCGASAYVTKPFSPQYLLSMVNSQLDNVRRIRQSLMSSTKVPVSEEKVMEESDKKFMDSFYKYIEEHISDAELQMNEVTVLFGMSRSKLFYKTKSLTGETPNAFFKAYKLNRAAEMILEGKEKLSYIADITGFSSPSHFSSSFKKQFGCSPSEYKGSEK